MIYVLWFFDCEFYFHSLQRPKTCRYLSSPFAGRFKLLKSSNTQFTHPLQTQHDSNDTSSLDHDCDFLESQIKWYELEPSEHGSSASRFASGQVKVTFSKSSNTHACVTTLPSTSNDVSKFQQLISGSPFTVKQSSWVESEISKSTLEMGIQHAPRFSFCRGCIFGTETLTHTSIGVPRLTYGQVRGVYGMWNVARVDCVFYGLCVFGAITPPCEEFFAF